MPHCWKCDAPVEGIRKFSGQIVCEHCGEDIE